MCLVQNSNMKTQPKPILKIIPIAKQKTKTFAKGVKLKLKNEAERMFSRTFST